MATSIKQTPALRRLVYFSNVNVHFSCILQGISIKEILHLLPGTGKYYNYNTLKLILVFFFFRLFSIGNVQPKWWRWYSCMINVWSTTNSDCCMQCYTAPRNICVTCLYRPTLLWQADRHQIKQTIKNETWQTEKWSLHVRNFYRQHKNASVKSNSDQYYFVASVKWHQQSQGYHKNVWVFSSC